MLENIDQLQTRWHNLEQPNHQIKQPSVNEVYQPKTNFQQARQ